MKKFWMIALVALSASFLGATSASAHASLTWSSPSVGSTLDVAPTDVTLVFDDDIQVIDGTKANLIEVTNETGDHFESGETQVNAAKVFVALTDLLDGTYTVAYKVISADGHPVSGEYSFVLDTGTTLMASDSVKRGTEVSNPTEAPDVVAFSSDDESSDSEATEEPEPAEITMDSPATTSVGGSDQSVRDNSGLWISLAVLVILAGAGGFYLRKHRKSNS